MVRDNRIKSFIFPAFTVTGSTFSSMTDHVLNGEILKLQFTNITSPGSIWLAESGNGIELFKKNNLTSGLANFEVYPFDYGVDSVGTTGSPVIAIPKVTNNILVLAGSGFTSGTSKVFGPVELFYR